MENDKTVEMEKMAEKFKDMKNDAKERIEAVGEELEKDRVERLENLKDKVTKAANRDCTCSPTATTDTFLGGFCLGAFVTVCVAFATRAINRH